LVKNNFTFLTYASVLSPLDSGTTFAPLFITPLPSVGIAPPARVTLVLTMFLTAKPATVAAATAGIAAGYPLNTSCNTLIVLITVCALLLYQLLIPYKYIRYNTKLNLMQLP
jgi:hypothetical protein